MAAFKPLPTSFRLITPSIYGQILNKCWETIDLPIPDGRWMEWRDRAVDRSQNSLHLDSAHSQSIRRVYGYVCHIKVLKKTSQNTDSSFLLTVVIKISSPEISPIIKTDRFVSPESARSHRIGRLDSGAITRLILRWAILPKRRFWRRHRVSIDSRTSAAGGGRV